MPFTRINADNKNNILQKKIALLAQNKKLLYKCNNIYSNS